VKFSASAVRTLEAVRDHPGLTPGDLALCLWPGRQGVAPAAGSILARLRKKRLVTLGHCSRFSSRGKAVGYFLTRAGKDILFVLGKPSA
jgi:hypothetical protein